MSVEHKLNLVDIIIPLKNIYNVFNKHLLLLFLNIIFNKY